jgi:uncharacterized metal-binding protein YceD (DUF177 family)
MTPELHRPVRIERIGPGGLTVDVVPTPAEREALAERMQIPAIEALSCRFTLRPGPSDTFLATGELTARIVQTCVVTLDDFEASVTEPFTVRFVPAGTESEEVDLEGEDEIPYENETLDVGEAAAEQLALSLDPYPRKPGAELPEDAQAESLNPFETLRNRLQ